MKHLLTVTLLTLGHQAQAQVSRIETGSDGVVRAIAVLQTTPVDATVHEFSLQIPNPDPATVGNYPFIYPRLLRMSSTGRMGIGYNTSDFPRSMLNVGQGLNTFSVDELGSERPNGKQLIPGVPGGGVCIGLNASRQADAAIACDLNAATNRNGGAMIWADGEGTLNFTAFPSNRGATPTGPLPGTQHFLPSDVVGYRVMKLLPQNSGQVQIGPAAPPTASPHTDYRLAVDGKLVAKSIFVTQVGGNWADFVFAPTYALQPLPELEAYLKQNRHLPAIPSATEVAKNGIDLGEMDARLLQSLEELTLHVIALGKQNERLQTEVTALAAKVNQAPAASK